VRQKALSVALYLISFGVRYSDDAARGIHAGSTSQDNLRSPASEREVRARTKMIDLNIKTSILKTQPNRIIITANKIINKIMKRSEFKANLIYIV
jgi:hypothetical protein